MLNHLAEAQAAHQPIQLKTRQALILTACECTPPAPSPVTQPQHVLHMCFKDFSRHWQQQWPGYLQMPVQAITESRKTTPCSRHNEEYAPWQSINGLQHT